MNVSSLCVSLYPYPLPSLEAGVACEGCLALISRKHPQSFPQDMNVSDNLFSSYIHNKCEISGVDLSLLWTFLIRDSLDHLDQLVLLFPARTPDIWQRCQTMW